MCIAIVKKKGASISDEELKNSFNNNPDGAGLAYTTGGKLYYIKGLFNVKDFISAVRETEKIADGDMLIHCRIGTSGLKDKDNCHPHVVNNKTVMIHNGILDIEVPKDSKVSDTVIFTNELLSTLPVDFIKSKGILKLIGYTIGKNNKFAFLNSEGESAIVNEEQGEWKNNVWYSNSTYSYDKDEWVYTPYARYSQRFDYEGYAYNDWDEIGEYALSKNKIKKLRKKIQNMPDDELVMMGDYPIYDITNDRLVSEYEEPAGQWLYLEEISQELYWDYMEQLDLRGLAA